jgi:hypothetical protein
MACLVVEIMMIFSGLYTLVTAKLNLTDRVHLQGWRARVVGLLWIAPLPVTFVIGLVAGVMMSIGIIPRSATTYISCIEPLMVIGVIIISLIIAFTSE